MGIKGLGGFIKWRVPHVRKSLNWITHAGEHWGIDCSCLLYKAKGAGLSPMTVIVGLIVKMRRVGIIPIFVFDGRSPAAKADVIDQRRVVRQAAQKEIIEIKAGLGTEDLSLTEKMHMERRVAALQRKAPTVSSSEKDNIKKLLYSAGVQFITASEEADDVLGYLCRQSMLQGVVSSDMDMLARGVPLLIIPETTDATVLTEIRLSDVLTGLGLKQPQFVDACMLMGSDYSAKGWSSIEPKAAVEIARRGFDWASFSSDCAVMEQGVALLNGYGVKWEDIVSEKQRAKWDAGRPPCEPATLTALASEHGWPADWVAVLSK